MGILRDVYMLGASLVYSRLLLFGKVRETQLPGCKITSLFREHILLQDSTISYSYLIFTHFGFFIVSLYYEGYENGNVYCSS